MLVTHVMEVVGVLSGLALASIILFLSHDGPPPDDEASDGKQKGLARRPAPLRHLAWLRATPLPHGTLRRHPHALAASCCAGGAGAAPTGRSGLPR
jgi:hypothetical protein